MSVTSPQDASAVTEAIEVNPRLTEHQWDICVLVTRGHTNEEIAAELGLAATTVKVLMKYIFRKFHCSTRTRLAYLIINQYGDHLPPLPEGFFIGRMPAKPFTPKERAVLDLVKQGKTNKEIAKELNVVEHTVKVHVRHAIGKTGCKSRLQLAVLSFYSSHEPEPRVDPSAR